jgi:hypothetical protein
MFEYPVPCYGCLDGPGHLVSHLMGRKYTEVTQKITLLGKVPLEGRYMQFDCIILSTLDEDETFSLSHYFPKLDEYILRTLEENIHEITRSQFLLLVAIWNIFKGPMRKEPAYAAAIIVGIRKALQRPHDPRSTVILAPLSVNILNFTGIVCASGVGTFAEREVIKKEATVTSNLMLSSLAARSIFGRQNGQRIFCARAVGDSQAAVGWLTPYTG